MKLEDNDFVLFGLAERYALDRDALDRRWRELQREVHPDRFASQGPAAQRIAMQWAVRVNEAYVRLKDPLSRAAYLCELRGVRVEAERNTAMPQGFLAQQMEWRERLEEASEPQELLALREEILASDVEQSAALARCLDAEADTEAAAALVRSMMFVRRFRDDVERRMERVGL